MNPKLKGMLGLAMRAGKLACGESKAAEAIRGGRAELVLLSADASDNTEKRFLNMTQYCVRRDGRFWRPFWDVPP